MRKYIIIITFLLGSLAPCCTFAARAEAPEVYVVDMQYILAESIAGKAAQSDFESELRKGQAKLEQLKLELDQLGGALAKQSSVLSPQALEAKKEELRKKEREAMGAMQDFRRDAAEKNGVLVARLVREVERVLNDIARQRNYRFVLDRGEGVIYAAPHLDLSAEVVKELDKRKLSFN